MSLTNQTLRLLVFNLDESQNIQHPAREKRQVRNYDTENGAEYSGYIQHTQALSISS